MDIQQLEFFCDVVRTGSINRAAQLNYVAPSSISRSMRSLEQETNALLFKRSHTGMILTTHGEELYAMVEPMLHDFHNVQELFFSQSEKKDLLRLTLCIHHNSISEQALLDFYTSYANETEYVDIVVAEYMSLREVLLNMQSKYYMLGTVQYGSNHREEVHKLLDEYSMKIIHENTRKIYISLRSGHPLASKDVISDEELLPFPRVAYIDEKVADMNYCADMYNFNVANTKKRILIRDRAQIDEILRYTDAYFIGTGDRGVDLLKYSRHVCIPLNTEQKIITSLICKKDCILTKSAKRYTDILINLFNQTE